MNVFAHMNDQQRKAALDVKRDYHNMVRGYRYPRRFAHKDNVRSGDVVMSYSGVLYRLESKHGILHLRRMFTLHPETQPTAQMSIDMLNLSLFGEFYRIYPDEVVRFAGVARDWQRLTHTSIFSSAVFVLR